MNDAIRELAGQGVRGVVIVPLGFVSDHMEVLWDLDEEATQTAHEAGLAVARVPTPGVDPAFVAGLVDLVAERHTSHARAARGRGRGADGAARADPARPVVRRVPGRLLREPAGRASRARARGVRVRASGVRTGTA